MMPEGMESSTFIATMEILFAQGYIEENPENPDNVRLTSTGKDKARSDLLSLPPESQILIFMHTGDFILDEIINSDEDNDAQG